MKFQNADGSLSKRGYVVTFEGVNKLYKTKKDVLSASEKDFKKEDCPIWWVDGLGMSKLEHLNS